MSTVRARVVGGGPTGADIAALDRVYASVVERGMKAWTITQAELDRLLRQRIDELI